MSALPENTHAHVNGTMKTAVEWPLQLFLEYRETRYNTYGRRAHERHQLARCRVVAGPACQRQHHASADQRQNNENDHGDQDWIDIRAWPLRWYHRHAGIHRRIGDTRLHPLRGHRHGARVGWITGIHWCAEWHLRRHHHPRLLRILRILRVLWILWIPGGRHRRSHRRYARLRLWWGRRSWWHGRGWLLRYPSLLRLLHLEFWCRGLVVVRRSRLSGNGFQCGSHHERRGWLNNWLGHLRDRFWLRLRCTCHGRRDSLGHRRGRLQLCSLDRVNTRRRGFRRWRGNWRLRRWWRHQRSHYGGRLLHGTTRCHRDRLGSAGHRLNKDRLHRRGWDRLHRRDAGWWHQWLAQRWRG